MPGANNPIVKITMGGQITPLDRWSTTQAFEVSGGVPSLADMNGIANGAATFWAADVWDKATNGMKALGSPTCSWDECKTYYYPANSLVATVSGTKVITPDFCTNTLAFPPQIAAVVSFHTGFSGRKNRGRSYMPPASSIISPGLFNSTFVDGLAANFAKYFTDMNAATVGSLSFNACIGTGDTPHILTVTVDNVPDTQRRRRDKAVATHTGTGTV